MRSVFVVTDSYIPALHMDSDDFLKSGLRFSYENDLATDDRSRAGLDFPRTDDGSVSRCYQRVGGESVGVWQAIRRGCDPDHRGHDIEIDGVDAGGSCEL